MENTFIHIHLYTITIGDNGFIYQSMHFEADIEIFCNGIALHAYGACIAIKIFITFMSSRFTIIPLYISRTVQYLLKMPKRIFPVR